MAEIKTILNKILVAAIKNEASDAFVKADQIPMLKINDELIPVEVDKFTPEMTEHLAKEIMPSRHMEEFETTHEANFTYVIPEGRFRTNVMLQRGYYGFVFRRIEEKIPDFKALYLPEVLGNLSMVERGLILVTGPTGSGKSTTLASMIEHRNQNASNHIITIEDPIEYFYKDDKCLINQREIGQDTVSFGKALENAVRQAPDVLLIGEMRDPESVNAAVFFAETGHLVLSTLHSLNTTQTVERILNFFTTDVQEQMLKQLALTLHSIISQRLIPRKDGKGLIPAVEILIMNARMKDLLSKNELGTLKREIDQFIPDGMQSFDHAILELYKQDLITKDDAIRFADNSHDMKLSIKTLPTYITGENK
ncbi:MAG: PilT/PilU family type 4a pilus ATPase [Armatimonadota bacterium]